MDGRKYYFLSNISIDLNNKVWVSLHEDMPNSYEFAIGIYEEDQWDIINDFEIGIEGKGIRSLHFDSNNNLWLKPDDHKTLIKYNGVSWNTIEIPIDNMSVLGLSVYLDVFDRLWFTTNTNKILMFDGAGNWNLFELESIGLSEGHCISIRVDEDDNWWLLYVSGLRCSTYLYNGNSISELKLGNSALTNNTVLDIVVDGELNSWLLHLEGLEKFEQSNSWTYYYPTLSQDNLYLRKSLILDANQLPWYIGFDSVPPYNSSIIFFDGNEFQHEPFNNSSGNIPSSLQEIAFDNENNLWSSYLLSEVGVKQNQTQQWEHHEDIQYPDSLNLFFTSFSDIDISQQGTVWIADSDLNGGLFSYKNESWKHLITPTSELHDFMVASNSDVWVGAGFGVDGGYVIYQYSNEEWITHDLSLQFKLDPINAFWDSNFLTFEEDLEGNIWISGIEGLYKYNGMEWEWFNTLNSKLPCNRIHDIHIDRNNNMWLATICGLVVFNENGLNGIVTESKNPYKLSESNIILKPNPALNTILIKFEGFNNEELEYKIVDIMGSVLLEKRNTDNEVLLNVSNLSPGIYFIQVGVGNKLMTKKFIKI